MWRLIDCFRNSGQEQIRSRTVVADATQHIAQYQAPVVTPSPRAGSTSSCDDEQDFERGTLLPKVLEVLVGNWKVQDFHDSKLTGPSRAPLRVASAASHGKGHSLMLLGQDLGPVLGQTHPCNAKAWGALGAWPCWTLLIWAMMAVLDVVDVVTLIISLFLLTAADNPKIFTRCGHSFHMQCIYAWLERKSTCPLCERPMDLQDDIIL
eukprot:gene4327-4580_t